MRLMPREVNSYDKRTDLVCKQSAFCIRLRHSMCITMILGFSENKSRVFVCSNGVQ